jgi:hypothetical protein
MLTSRLDVTYPLVPLWESHGVGIALFSYLGTVSWGLNADYDVVEDVSNLAASLQFATAELLAAAAEHVANLEATKKTATRRKAPPTEKASGNGGSKTRKQAKKRPPMGTR